MTIGSNEIFLPKELKSSFSTKQDHPLIEWLILVFYYYYTQFIYKKGEFIIENKSLQNGE